MPVKLPAQSEFDFPVEIKTVRSGPFGNELVFWIDDGQKLIDHVVNVEGYCDRDAPDSNKKGSDIQIAETIPE